MTDITSRADIVQLVDRFYERVREDDLLGSIFTDIAQVDWSSHLPRMYDFWHTVLFGGAGFKGNPLARHLALAERTPLTVREFDRWIHLFHQTVDALFAGPIATAAKQRAVQIAATLQHHVAARADSRALHLSGTS